MLQTLSVTKSNERPNTISCTEQNVGRTCVKAEYVSNVLVRCSITSGNFGVKKPSRRLSAQLGNMHEGCAQFIAQLGAFPASTASRRITSSTWPDLTHPRQAVWLIRQVWSAENMDIRVFKTCSNAVRSLKLVPIHPC